MLNSTREIKAVSEAIDSYERSTLYANTEGKAQAAIAASDSQYVKGLVEALKFYLAKTEEGERAEEWKERMKYDCGWEARFALQQLPEDLKA